MSKPIAASSWEPAPHWLRACGVALLLHLAVIGGAMPTFRSVEMGSPATTPRFAVMLLPDPPPVPNDIAPGPTQNEARPKPSFQPKVRMQFERPPVLKMDVPATIVLAKTADKPTPHTPHTARKAVATTTRPPAATQPQIAAPQAGRITTPTQAWESELLAKLERNKRYPSRALYYRLQDTVYVHFVMDRGGHVLSSSILKSDHYQELDDEALSVLQRSQPLPPPPPEVNGQTISLTVPVEFYIR